MVRRIGAVVVAVDGFTGERIIDHSLFVHCKNGGGTVRKPDGYYVFWDDGNPELGVVIESAWFEKVTLILFVSRLREKKDPVYFVYLVPSKAYPYPVDCEWRDGSGSPGAMLWAALKGTEQLLRIEEFTAMGPQGHSVMHVKNHYRILLEDRLLYVSDGEAGEFFKTGEACGGEMSRLSLLGQLQGQYVQERMRLWLVYRTKADGSGKVRIPGECRMRAQEEKAWDFAYAAEQL